eukprot:1035536-Pleurochrysis_carterae.AAC.2
MRIGRWLRLASDDDDKPSFRKTAGNLHHFPSSSGVNSSAVAISLVQGLLRKRKIPRLWGVSETISSQTAKNGPSSAANCSCTSVVKLEADIPVIGSPAMVR